MAPGLVVGVAPYGGGGGLAGDASGVFAPNEKAGVVLDTSDGVLGLAAVGDEALAPNPDPNFNSEVGEAAMDVTAAVVETVAAIELTTAGVFAVNCNFGASAVLLTDEAAVVVAGVNDSSFVESGVVVAGTITLSFFGTAITGEAFDVGDVVVAVLNVTFVPVAKDALDLLSFASVSVFDSTAVFTSAVLALISIDGLAVSFGLTASTSSVESWPRKKLNIIDNFDFAGSRLKLNNVDVRALGLTYDTSFLSSSSLPSHVVSLRL